MEPIAATSAAHRYQGSVVSDGSASLSGSAGAGVKALGSAGFQFDGNTQEFKQIDFGVKNGTFLLFNLMIDGRLIDSDFNVARYVRVGMLEQMPALMPLQIKLAEKNTGTQQFNWNGKQNDTCLAKSARYFVRAQLLGKDGRGLAWDTQTIDLDTMLWLHDIKVNSSKKFMPQNNEKLTAEYVVNKDCYVTAFAFEKTKRQWVCTICENKFVHGGTAPKKLLWDGSARSPGNPTKVANGRYGIIILANDLPVNDYRQYIEQKFGGFGE